MKAVPQMESFIKEVCILVQEVSSRENNQSVIGIDVFFAYTIFVQAIIPTLKQWIADRERYKKLASFKNELCKVLYKKSVEVSEQQIVSTAIIFVIDNGCRRNRKYCQTSPDIKHIVCFV